MAKTICVFTATRAEYGLLSALMGAIMDHPDLKLKTLVSGTHLSEDFGSTYQEIQKDGFLIDHKVEIPLNTDTGVGVSRSIGVAVEEYAKVLSREPPDVLLVLGDRYEALAVVIAAATLQIPVAHLHGGELTRGALDEYFRHAITKMSHWHFTATEEYRKRVIQLGEEPQQVFNVGALGVENIKNLTLLSKAELEESLDFKFKKRNLLVTYHPETLGKGSVKQQVEALLEALSRQEDAHIVFSKANADKGGQVVNAALSEFVRKCPSNTSLFSSLGQSRYLSMMQYADAMVGNSSSGIIEAASFKLPVVNIGSRQDGRIKPLNVIDTPSNTADIAEAIRKALSREFKDSLAGITNPYGDGETSGKIVSILADANPDDVLIKNFYDMPINGGAY